LNLSFESGDLSGWDAEGAIVVPWFGDTLPKNGVFMMLLSTGGFVETQSSSAVLATCVPENTASLTFDWKFYSEEFLEWCGSPYQDSFRVELVLPESEIILLDYKIDDLCPEGSSGIQVVESDVTLDQGDVYESPWVSTTVSLASEVVGAPFELRFFATDAGDSLYDTVVLIDHIRFEPCIPNCMGLVCGDDGCGGSCGGCDDMSSCSSDGQCEAISCAEEACPDGLECCDGIGGGDTCLLEGDCPEEDPNSCEGNCGGQAASGCFCNSFCNLVGNCCPDFEDACDGDETGSEGGETFCEANSDCEEGWVCCDLSDVGVGICALDGTCLEVADAWSCEGNCGGIAPAGCLCVEACVILDNCCDDYNEACPGEETCNSACNTTVEVAEGDQVIPSTNVHLTLEIEEPSACFPVTYKWMKDVPDGSCVAFKPNESSANPSVVLNRVGSHKFWGGVVDGEGKTSCKKGFVEVVVIPDDLIYVELSWETQNDEDPCDQGPEAGADLDLHFAHPFASGEDVDGDGEPDGWFDQPFDCYWFNPNPEWGALDPTVNDNPILLIDDTDGAGPEAISLNKGEPDALYKIGVHYWNDHDFGISDARIHVYYMGALTFTWEDVSLENHDMWEVGTVNGSTGEVLQSWDSSGNPKITPDYESPFLP
jgi:hypothetical protein